MSDYRAEYMKDPTQIFLSLNDTKPGLYRISGNIAPAAWEEVCGRIGVTPCGGCHADLVFDITRSVIKVSGSIQTKMERTCRRTLDSFLQEETFQVDETVEVQPSENQIDEDFVVSEGVLNVGEFVIQYIIIAMDAYPLSPDAGSKQSTFQVNDSLQGSEAEKNPFSVLKGLKF